MSDEALKARIHGLTILNKMLNEDLQEVSDERTYLLGRLVAAHAAYLVFGHNIDREKANIEAEAQVSAGLRSFREATKHHKENNS